jgi:hypothetical protein
MWDLADDKNSGKLLESFLLTRRHFLQPETGLTPRVAELVAFPHANGRAEASLAAG